MNSLPKESETFDISVVDYLTNVLAKHGVSTVFGLLGEGNMKMLESMRSQGFEWVALRREDAAVAAAEAFAVGSECLGVVTVTHGPALINALNPLVCVNKGSTSVLLITGEIEKKNSWQPQYVNQQEICSSLGIEYVSISNLDSAKIDIENAINTCVSKKKAVVIGLPISLQKRLLTLKNSDLDNSKIQTQETKKVPQSHIQEAIKRINSAKKPVILCGRGGITSSKQILNFGDRCGALFATSLLARGLFSDSDFDIGFLGGFSNSLTRTLINESDLVIVLGASLDGFTLGYGGFEWAKFQDLIHVDINACEILLPKVNKLDVQMDVAQFLELIKLEIKHDNGFRTEEVKNRIKYWEPQSEFVDETNTFGIDLRTASIFIQNNYLSPHGLAVDLGYFTSEPIKYITVVNPNHFAFPLHFGSIGFGLPAAIGLSVAHKDLPIICAVGDGGLMQSIGELDTVVRYNLPILIAVFNDSAYGVEYHFMKLDNLDFTDSLFPTINFASIASAHGIKAYVINSIADFNNAISDLRAGAQLLLDIRMNRDVITSWWTEIIESISKRG